MRTLKNITINTNKTSKTLILIIIISYSIFIALAMATGINYELKSLIIVLSATYLYYELKQHLLKSDKKTIKVIYYNHPGFWRLSVANGNNLAASLIKPIFKSSHFIILNFEDLETKNTYKVIIAKDMLEADTFHKLKFICNMAI